MKTNKSHKIMVGSKVNSDKYRLFSDLMKYVPDVIYFKDRSGKLVMVNYAHAKGLGLEPDQVVGKTDFDFFPKTRAKKMLEDDRRVIMSGKPIIDKIERATRADGVDNYVSTTKIPRYDEKGRIVGLIGITRDITRRMQYERLRREKETLEKRVSGLEELSRLKSDFISIVSHELRTPLAIIKEVISQLHEELPGPLNKKQKEFLEKADSNAGRLKNMIEQLLDISRIEAAGFKMHYSLVNFNDLLLESSDFFRKLSSDKGVTLEYHLPKEQVNIFVDYERISQVISNLITNAIKFTESAGSIRVELMAMEGRLRVGVKDSGIGISKEGLEKLFSKFTQVSDSHSARRQGLGLGLFVSKELIDKHGGDIRAGSKLGVGSEFCFTLPGLYTLSVIDAQVREKINSLLKGGIPAYLISLIIVNYNCLKQRAKLKVESLFEGLSPELAVTFRKLRLIGDAQPQVVFADKLRGECSMVFLSLLESKAAQISKVVIKLAKGCLVSNSINKIFVNTGVVNYPWHDESERKKQAPVEVRIKKIYIGREVRRFRRAGYRALVQLFLDAGMAENCQSVDISKGGICFYSSKRIETDSLVDVTLPAPKAGNPLLLKGRVAWTGKIEGALKSARAKYRTGLEFIDLKNKSRNRISKLVNSVADS